MFGIFSQVQGWLKIKGDTDGTKIGNVGDALKVVTSQSGIADGGKLFTVSRIINAATSGTDNPLLLLKNPTGSAKKFYIWRMRLGSSVTNTSMLYRVFINPTVTANGTAVAPINTNVGGSNPATVAQAFLLPTVSANGQLLTIAVVGQNNISIDLDESFSVILQPNTSLMITGSPSSNNREASVSLVWQEESI